MNLKFTVPLNRVAVCSWKNDDKGTEGVLVLDRLVLCDGIKAMSLATTGVIRIMNNSREFRADRSNETSCVMNHSHESRADRSNKTSCIMDHSHESRADRSNNTSCVMNLSHLLKSLITVPASFLHSENMSRS